MEPGDSVLVRGALTEYHGLLEIEPDTVIVLDDDAGMPEPVNVTVADLLAGGETYESLVIEVGSLSVSTDDAMWEESTTYTVGDAEGDSIAFRVQSGGESHAATGRLVLVK